jgi:glutamate-1-semialdehyde 2,1-aminomutase
MNHKKSQQLFSQAQEVLVGGVNSPVRAFKSVGGEPPFIERAKGAYVWDVDGNRYVDYVGSWGAAILGHADDGVLQVLQEVSQKGLSFGAPCANETLLAEAIRAAVPSMEKIRFVSSGTEACMSAVRLARGYTGRDKIVKFVGCYHGHADSFLVKAGSGVLTLGLPDSPGVPKDLAQHTLTVEFNDLVALKDVLAKHKQQIAAVILEPIMGNAGMISPLPGFLQQVAEVTREAGALLVFDEVMTGFRVAWGGAQRAYGIDPDLSTFGKVIGGGMPLAAFGGKAKIMDRLAPLGPVYQAGTLSGNPLAVAVGLKTLQILQSKDYGQLEKRTLKLVQGLQQAAAQVQIPFSYQCKGGMFGFFLVNQSIESFHSVASLSKDLFNRFFWAMQEFGYGFAPSMFEAGFVSFAHTDHDIDQTIGAARLAFSSLKS